MGGIPPLLRRPASRAIKRQHGGNHISCTEARPAADEVMSVRRSRVPAPQKWWSSLVRAALQGLSPKPLDAVKGSAFIAPNPRQHSGKIWPLSVLLCMRSG